MLVKVINVEISKVPGKGKAGGYEVAEILYDDDRGGKKTWKLVSFANPAVYSVFKDAKEGDTFEVDKGKNDNGYDTWTSASRTSTSSSAAPASSGVPGTKAAPVVSRSTYETPEERALKQRLIVRQSSLAQAIAFHGGVTPLTTSTEALLAATLLTAEQFYNWVYYKPAEDLFDTDNDIPY